MNDVFGHVLSLLMGFFATVNPIANTPVFLGLTANDSPAARKCVAAKALLTTFVIIVVFCLLGILISDLFGITLPAFQITCGVLVALICFQMLHGNQTSVHQPASEDRTSSMDAALSVAATPLAIPILGAPAPPPRLPEVDPVRVARARVLSFPVFYGDASRI